MKLTGKNLIENIQESISFLHSPLAYGQKKTIKRMFKTMRFAIEDRAIDSGINIRINSIFFDKEKNVLFLYSVYGGDALATIKINIGDKGKLIPEIPAGTMPEHQILRLARVLKSWFNTSLPLWLRELAANKAPQGKYVASKNKLEEKEKVKIKTRKRESNRHAENLRRAMKREKKLLE